ncbi:PilW family protein [Roseateles sp. BYS180W]|uniref:PilW family protein n=1 Tax=Roseateles rivi TaxID=3299028 RepID=A0ABW7FRD8_9BURK
MPYLPALQHRRRGFSLVELMVALTIGIVLVLVVTTMMARYEGSRRTLTSTNDAAQTGAYLSYLLDQELRSAGSGLTQNRAQVWGCEILAARAGVQILPHPAAFAAPFAALPRSVRLLPVLIHAGAGAGGSDVLAIASGAHGMAEASMVVANAGITSNSLRLGNTVGVSPNDLLLLSGSLGRCMVQHVSEVEQAENAAPSVGLGGTYHAETISGTHLTDFNHTPVARISMLGSAAPTANPPRLLLLGLGNGGQLMSLDLLQINGNAVPTLMADGVVALRALYGVDANGDGMVDAWVAPTAAGFDAATLAVAPLQRLEQIMAVRVDMVLRNDLVERAAVAPASLTLFADLAAEQQQVYNIPEAQRQQRHRLVSVSAPLRNVMTAVRGL